MNLAHAPVRDDDFEVAGFRVRPSLHRLEGPHGETPLEPRVMRLLVELARHPGEVVPKEKLLEVVWEGRLVTDNSLSNAVSLLRRVLGDDPREPRILETIRGVGYRLVAPVEVEDFAAPQAPPSSLRSLIGPASVLGVIAVTFLLLGRGCGQEVSSSLHAESQITSISDIGDRN